MNNDTKQAIWAPDLIPGLAKLSNGAKSYSEFRKELKTPFLRVQLGILATFFAIAISYIVLINYSFNLFFNVIICLFISLNLHRLMNVIHEGAHWLIGKKRLFNDLFCNLISGVFFLVDVDQYRITHIRHHRNLGDANDPENAHMEKLDLTLLVSIFSGIGSIKRLTRRKNVRELNSINNTKTRHLIVPLIGILVHLSLIYLLSVKAEISSFIVWLLAVYSIAPGLGILRNLLEHRYVECVDVEIWKILLGSDFKSDSNKVTTRKFTVSPLSRLYGTMGFTRHLIHHWDPSISFTNLKKVDDFLCQTEIGPALIKTNSTFTATFIQLWNK